MVKIEESTAKILRIMGAKQNKLLSKLIGTARIAGTRSSLATKGSLIDKFMINTPKIIDTLLTGGEFTEGNKTLVKSTLASVVLLTGILGTLSQVPSILQASLKMTKIGFLLILKPLADLIGALLMPIASVIIKIGMWAMKLTGIEKVLFGLGTLLGLILTGITGLAIAGIASGAITGLGGIGAASLIALKLFGIAIIGITAGLLFAWGVIKTLSTVTNLLSIGWGILKDWLYTFADSLEEKHPLIAKFVKLLGDGAGFMENLTSTMSTVLDEMSTFGGYLRVLSGLLFKISGGKEGTKYNSVGQPEHGEVWSDKKQTWVMAASGGIFNQPTKAIIGEAGPEAVIPLNKMNEVTGGKGDTTINVNGIVDENKFRDIIKDVVRQLTSEHYDYSGAVI